MKLILIFSIIYVFLLILGYSVQTKLIFYPSKLDKTHIFSKELNSEEVFLSTIDGQVINGLFFSDRSEKVILYFHGNAGSLNSWQFIYPYFKPLGFNFLIIDYRGYGKSTGKISEEGLYIDGQTAYNYLLEKGFMENQVIVYGRSIGTGVAVDLACEKNIHALILEAPFVSLRKFASEKFSFLLPSLLLKYEFSNLSKINRVNAPVLVLHGKQDEVIPFRQGEELFRAYHGQKEFLSFEQGQHNNLTEFPEFSQGIMHFLEHVDQVIN